MARKNRKALYAKQSAIMLGGLVPVVGPVAPLAAIALEDINRIRLKRFSRAVRLACDVAGMTRKQLQRALKSDPRLVPLTARVLHACGVNGNDKALEMMARCLGAALHGERAPDEAEALMVSFESLGEPQIAMLEMLARDPNQFDDEASHTGVRWTPGRLAFASNRSMGMVTVGLQGLLNSGLVMHTGIDGGRASHEGMGAGGQTYAVTELGASVLEALTRTGTSSSVA